MYFSTELGIRLIFVKTSEFRGGGLCTPLLEVSPTHHFCLTIGNNNMVEAPTCEAGMVLAPCSLRVRKLCMAPEKCAPVQVIFV
jgi:hypothetical protein